MARFVVVFLILLLALQPLTARSALAVVGVDDVALGVGSAGIVIGSVEGLSYYMEARISQQRLCDYIQRSISNLVGRYTLTCTGMHNWQRTKVAMHDLAVSTLNRIILGMVNTQGQPANATLATGFDYSLLKSPDTVRHFDGFTGTTYAQGKAFLDQLNAFLSSVAVQAWGKTNAYIYLEQLEL